MIIFCDIYLNSILIVTHVNNSDVNEMYMFKNETCKVKKTNKFKQIWHAIMFQILYFTRSWERVADMLSTFLSHSLVSNFNYVYLTVIINFTTNAVRNLTFCVYNKSNFSYDTLTSKRLYLSVYKYLLKCYYVFMFKTGFKDIWKQIYNYKK